MTTMGNADKIARLEAFQVWLADWNRTHDPDVRARINREKLWVRQRVLEAGCYRTMTITPPPAIGGMAYQDADMFDMIFGAPYRMNVAPNIRDMIDATIGVLSNDASAQRPDATASPGLQLQVRLNYAFVVMPMDSADTALPDVLDSIKEAARRCGIEAERIDDPQTNERITDRILESIGYAEFVIADLTNSKPNVYYEAGYAHALGKTPIFVARDGTKLEFDLKDYPIIFFKNYKQLKEELEKRLRALAERRGT
jgi:hypothetical protein